MKPKSLIFPTTIILSCFALTFTAPPCHAAESILALPHSPSSPSALTAPTLLPHTSATGSSRSFFHLTTTTSCNAAQTQCVASCSSQSGQAAQNCVSDCNDVRSVCQ